MRKRFKTTCILKDYSDPWKNFLGLSNSSVDWVSDTECEYGDHKQI